jgi:hypothetical protein
VATMSFLDDLTLVVPAVLAAGARDIVREELRGVGLGVNMDKSVVWSPSGLCPPGCEEWYASAARHDGLLVCGRPYGASLADLSYDPAGAAAVWPLGSPAFVDEFLAGYAAKVEVFLGDVCGLMTHAGAEEPARQCANLLIRHCSSAKAAHLLRILPPAATAAMSARIDAAVSAALA